MRGFACSGAQPHRNGVFCLVRIAVLDYLSPALESLAGLSSWKNLPRIEMGVAFR